MCKYFFVTLKEKYLSSLNPPQNPQRRKYQKPKVIYCRALLYTQTLWHHATRASICLCTFRISSKQLKDTTNPTSVSLITLAISSPFLGWEFWPITSPRSAPLTLTHSYGDARTHTHTYIHKAQWIELWSNTSMNTPNCLVVSTVQKREAGAVRWETQLFTVSWRRWITVYVISIAANSTTIIIFLTFCLIPHWSVPRSPVITSTRPKSTMLHALPLHMVNYEPLSFLLPDTSFKPAGRLSLNKSSNDNFQLYCFAGMAWTYLGLQYKIFLATP